MAVNENRRSRNWLFQCNPKLYDLASEIEAGLKAGDWSMNQNRDLISPGDRVFFWQAGPQAQLIAIGHVTSPVYQRDDNPFGRQCVDIAFEYKVVPPLTRDEARHNETLRNFRPFQGQMGTNFVISDPAIVAELDEAVSSRIVPISEGVEGPDINTQKTLDDAIREARADVTRKLLSHVANMDPTAVEWLACRLFEEIGYQDVEVTRRSGDSGIDVKATLVASGVAKIRTCIQVKRQPMVGRPFVQGLRGSLGPHEVGVLLTSGRFSDDAVKEAEDKTKTPITLIDGHRLAELLLEHQIGVSRRLVPLYTLQLGELDLEKPR